MTFASPTLPLVLAYLDPGSGSLIFQVMIAGMLSAAFFLKSSLIGARSVLGRVFRSKD